MATEIAERVCVTGAAGQAGRAVVHELLEHGYDVAATDLVAARDDLEAGMLRADLTDYGQALQVLEGAHTVVHLANIPAPGLSTPAVTFNANVAMNFNVFYAAARLGLRRVVWASSETTLGVRSASDRTKCGSWKLKASRRATHRWTRIITRWQR